MRLSNAKRSRGLLPVSRRDRVFHLPQRRTHGTDAAAIDLGASFDLPNTFLCRLMMGHLSTQLSVPRTRLNTIPKHEQVLIFHSVPPRQPPIKADTAEITPSPSISG